MRRSDARSNDGLTLLEMLVTLVILAIGITGVMKAFSSSLLTCRAAEADSMAALLAQQVMSELDRRDPDIGQLSGDFGNDAPGYVWQADVSQATSDLKRAVVVVSWQEKNRRKVFQMTTCLGMAEANATPSGSPGSTAPPVTP